jgi:hypothetical protein
MASGSLFRFSRPYMGTYRIGLIEKPELRLATAVAASAAFPPVMSPLVLHLDPDLVRKVKGADLWDDVSLRARVALLDGGAYDNMALEPITGRCETYLVSDAGGNFKVIRPAGRPGSGPCSSSGRWTWPWPRRAGSAAPHCSRRGRSIPSRCGGRSATPNDWAWGSSAPSPSILTGLATWRPCSVSVPDEDEAGQPRTRHLLIDVGNALVKQGQDDVFAPVFADIVAQTGGRIDLYVNSHEHLDHVQGRSSRTTSWASTPPWSTSG